MQILREAGRESNMGREFHTDQARRRPLPLLAHAASLGERYGACKICGGRGYLLKWDAVLLRDEKKECGVCEGTGFSGDATEYRDP
jgi:hypothetical protein